MINRIRALKAERRCLRAQLNEMRALNKELREARVAYDLLLHRRAMGVDVSDELQRMMRHREGLVARAQEYVVNELRAWVT